MSVDLDGRAVDRVASSFRSAGLGETIRRDGTFDAGAQPSLPRRAEIEARLARRF